MSAHIKTRQERQAEKYPSHPGNELALWARLKLADAEIAELRAALACHQGVAVPAGCIAPDWPYCNPGCDYEDPHGGHHDGRSAHCSCEAAKASIARQRAVAPQPPAVKEAEQKEKS